MGKAIAAPDVRCSDDHPHGSGSTCYSRHGCRCDDCRGWRSRQWANGARDLYKHDRRIRGLSHKVDPGPTVRRLRALACMGWGTAEVARRAGLHRRNLNRIRSGHRVEVDSTTADAVKATYRNLSTSKNTTPQGKAAATNARKNGWHGPMHWADIENGIPDE